MYHHLSRSLYRRLARVLPEGGSERQALLDACETTMLRLATDREYFAAPERFLFLSIRCLFPIHDQRRVRQIIDRDLRVAAAILEQQAVAGPRPCRATTRGGTPCQREPVGEGRYCPSHRHLEPEPEPFDAGAAPRVAVAA
jgi:hypothetical protein